MNCGFSEFKLLLLQKIWDPTKINKKILPKNTRDKMKANDIKQIRWRPEKRS